MIGAGSGIWPTAQVMLSGDVNRAALQSFRRFVGRMKRGELYLVSDPAGDPKRHRVFVVVSHQGLIDSRYSTVVCAPVYSHGEGLRTQVAIGPEEGLKHKSWITCDSLASVPKSRLTRYVASLSPGKVRKLNESLAFALDLPVETERFRSR